MEHMVAGHMVGTGWIEMTQSEMADSLIHLIDEVVEMGFTLVLVQTCIMVIITIILTGGMTWDIYRMSSRRKSHLHLMDKCRSHMIQKLGCLE